MPKKDKKGFFAEFKAFITRGNVMDMAVGVIIGSAFSAIVTAVVNKIFMPLIAMVTGTGLQGFVTVLNPEKASENIGEATNVVEYWGVKYNADVVNVINWGDVINAIINFLIIALILFLIIKVAGYIAAKKKAFDEMMLEQYYQKHPEERPAPAEPGVPMPTTNELLTQIRDLLKDQEKAGKKAEKKAKKEEPKEDEKK